MPHPAKSALSPAVNRGSITRTDALLAPVHALAVLAQTGSFTQAATRLGLSKAAVSQRISDLEQALGVSLVQRSTRSVHLTAAGEQLVADTAEGWARLEHALVSVRDREGSMRGLVRVTAPVALGRQHLAPLLPEFLRTHPGVHVDLDLADRLVPLVQEGVDLAVRHTNAAPDKHLVWPLAATRTVLVASRAYLRRRPAPVHPNELPQHDCLAYLRPGPAVWPFEQRPPAQNGRRIKTDAPQRLAVTVQGPLRVNNSEVLRDAVLAGLVMGLLPDFSAAAALRAGRLIEVLPDWQPMGFFGDAIVALRPWSPHVPRAVQALVDYLQHELAASLRGGG